MSIFRLSLLPISLLYAAVLRVRHALYDCGILHSTKIGIPSICIGNLELGGTGKTPLTEYIAKLLMDKRNVAIVSGGYKRKSKEAIIAGKDTTLDELGDEAMQYHSKFGENIKVAVGKNRAMVIDKLMNQGSIPETIIFDDAFQHRKIKAGFNILTTNYSTPFYDNHLIPAGTLRDIKSRACSADIIIVNKTPESATNKDKNRIRQKLSQYGNQNVYFASLAYGQPVACNIAAQSTSLDAKANVICLCGIAQPEYFILYLESKYHVTKKLVFSDHHTFSENDINRIKSEGKTIVTTEKDAMRLTYNPYFSELKNTPIYYIPIEVRFNADEASQLDKEIMTYVTKNQQSGSFYQ